MTERNHKKKRKITDHKNVMESTATSVVENGTNEITPIFELFSGNNLNSEDINTTHQAVRKRKKHSQSPKHKVHADEEHVSKSIENKSTSKPSRKTRHEHGRLENIPAFAAYKNEIITFKDIPLDEAQVTENKVRHSRSPKHKLRNKKGTEDSQKLLDIQENKAPSLKQSKVIESDHFFTRVGEWLKNSIVGNISYSMKQNDQNTLLKEEWNVDTASTRIQKKVHNAETSVIHEHSGKIRSKHNRHHTKNSNIVTEDIKDETNRKIKSSKLIKDYENTNNPQDQQKLSEGKKNLVERPRSPTLQNIMLEDNRGHHGISEIQTASSGISQRIFKNTEEQNEGKQKRTSVSPKNVEKSKNHTSPEKIKMDTENKHNNTTMNAEKSRKHTSPDKIKMDTEKNNNTTMNAEKSRKHTSPEKIKMDTENKHNHTTMNVEKSRKHTSPEKIKMDTENKHNHTTMNVEKSRKHTSPEKIKMDTEKNNNTTMNAEKSRKHTSPEKIKMDTENKHNHTTMNVEKSRKHTSPKDTENQNNHTSLSPEHSKKGLDKTLMGNDKQTQVHSHEKKHKKSSTPKSSKRQECEKSKNVDEILTKSKEKKERSLSLSPTILRKSSASDILKKMSLNRDKSKLLSAPKHSKRKDSEKHKHSMSPKTSEVSHNKERDITKNFQDKSGDYLPENHFFPVVIEEHVKHANRLAEKQAISSNLVKEMANVLPEMSQHETNTDLTLMDSKSLKMCYKCDKKKKAIRTKDNTQTKIIVKNNDNEETVSPNQSNGEKREIFDKSQLDRNHQKKNVDYTITGSLLFDTKSLHKSSKSTRHEIKLTNKQSGNIRNKKNKSSHKSKVSDLGNEVDNEHSMPGKNLEEKLIDGKGSKNSSQKNLDKINEMKNISYLEKLPLKINDTHEELASARNMVTDKFIKGNKFVNNDIIYTGMYSKVLNPNYTGLEFSEAMQNGVLNQHILQDSEDILQKSDGVCNSHIVSEEYKREYEFPECSMIYRNEQNNEYHKSTSNYSIHSQKSSNETHNLPKQSFKCQIHVTSSEVPQDTKMPDKQSAAAENKITKNTKVDITESFHEQEISNHFYNTSLTSNKSSSQFELNSMRKLQQKQIKSNIPQHIGQSNDKQSNQIDKTMLNKNILGSHKLSKEKINQVDIHNSCPLLSKNGFKNNFSRRLHSLPDLAKTKQENHINSVFSIRSTRYYQTLGADPLICDVDKKSLIKKSIPKFESEMLVLKKHSDISVNFSKQMLSSTDNVQYQKDLLNTAMKDDTIMTDVTDDILFYFMKKERIRSHDLPSEHHSNVTKYKTDFHNITDIQSGSIDKNIENLVLSKHTKETVSQINSTERSIEDSCEKVVVSKTNMSTSTKEFINNNSMDDTRTNCTISLDKTPSQCHNIFSEVYVTKTTELIDNISDTDLQNFSKTKMIDGSKTIHSNFDLLPTYQKIEILDINQKQSRDTIRTCQNFRIQQENNTEAFLTENKPLPVTRKTDKTELEDIQITHHPGQVENDTAFSSENILEKFTSSKTFIDSKDIKLLSFQDTKNQENTNSKSNTTISKDHDNIEVIFPLKTNLLQSQIGFNANKADADKELFHEAHDSENIKFIVSNSSEDGEKEGKLKENLGNEDTAKIHKLDSGTYMESQSTENIPRLEMSSQFQKPQEVSEKQVALDTGALYTAKVSTSVSVTNKYHNNIDVISTENVLTSLNKTNSEKGKKTKLQQITVEDTSSYELEDRFNTWWTYIQNEMIPYHDNVHTTNKNKTHKNDFTSQAQGKKLRGQNMNAMPSSGSRIKNSMDSSRVQKVNKVPFMTVGKYMSRLSSKIIEPPRHSCLSRKGLISEQLQNFSSVMPPAIVKKAKTSSEATSTNKECAVYKRNESVQGKRTNNSKNPMSKKSEKQNKAQNEKENVKNLQMKNKPNESNTTRTYKHTNYPITSNKPPPARKIQTRPKSINDDLLSVTSQESRVHSSKLKRRTYNNAPFISDKSRLKMPRQKREDSEDSRSNTSQDSRSFSFRTRGLSNDSVSITSQESKLTSQKKQNSPVHSRAKIDTASQQGMGQSKWSSNVDKKREKLITSKPGLQNTSRFQQQAKQTKLSGSKIDNQPKERSALKRQNKFPWKPKHGLQDKNSISEISKKSESTIKWPYSFIPLSKSTEPKRKPSIQSSNEQNVAKSGENISSDETKNSTEANKSSETMKIELNIFEKSDENEELLQTKKQEFTIDISKESMPKTDTNTNNLVGETPKMRNIISKVTIDVKLQQRAEGSDVKKEICIKSSTSINDVETELENVTSTARKLPNNNTVHTFSFGSMSEPNCSLKLEDNTRNTSNDSTTNTPACKNGASIQQKLKIENAEIPLLRLKPLEQTSDYVHEAIKESESGDINSNLCDLEIQRESTLKTMQKFENCKCNECNHLPEEKESVFPYYCKIDDEKYYNTKAIHLKIQKSSSSALNSTNHPVELTSNEVRCPPKEIEVMNKILEKTGNKNLCQYKSTSSTEISNSEKSNQEDFSINIRLSSKNLNINRSDMTSELSTQKETSLLSLYLNPSLQEKTDNEHTEDSKILKIEPKINKSFSETCIFINKDEYFDNYKSEMFKHKLSIRNSSSSIHSVKLMPHTIKNIQIYPYLEEDTTMHKQNTSLPEMLMSHLELPIQRTQFQLNGIERTQVHSTKSIACESKASSSLTSLTHDRLPSKIILNSDLQSTESSRIMVKSLSTAPLTAPTYAQFPEDENKHTKSTQCQIHKPPSFPVIVLSQVQLPIDNELSSFNLEKETAVEHLSKSDKNLLKTAQKDDKLCSFAPVKTSRLKRLPADKEYSHPILEQGMQSFAEEAMQLPTPNKNPEMVSQIPRSSSNIILNLGTEQKTDDASLKSPQSDDKSSSAMQMVAISPIILNDPSQTTQMDDESFLSLPVMALPHAAIPVQFPMSEFLVYQVQKRKGDDSIMNNKPSKYNFQGGTDATPDAGRRSTISMKRNLLFQKKMQSDQETDSSKNKIMDRQKRDTKLKTSSSRKTKSITTDKESKITSKTRKHSTKHQKAKESKITSKTGKHTTKHETALPSMKKIPAIEWDKGMYDVPSEEEINTLKDLPKEYSAAFQQAGKPSAEADHDSKDRLGGGRRFSSQQDKKITFDASRQKARRLSSSLSLLSRKSGSLEYKSGSQTEKPFKELQEDEKPKKKSSFFAKLKKLCCRRKQSEVPDYGWYEEPQIEEKQEQQLELAPTAEIKAPKVKFFSSDTDILESSFDIATFPTLGGLGRLKQEVEIQYDVEPWEVGHCLRQGFRPDGLALSGEICIGQKTEPIKEGVPIINISDIQDPATFLYRLGINVDKVESMFIKDTNLNGRIRAALIEATIWADQITKTKAVLLLHLAQKTKPSIIWWYPHLVEAIVNNRIQSAMKLNGFLQRLENLKEDKMGQFARTSVSIYSHKSDSSRRDSVASTYLPYKFDSKAIDSPKTKKRRRASTFDSSNQSDPKTEDSSKSKNKTKSSIERGQKEEDMDSKTALEPLKTEHKHKRKDSLKLAAEKMDGTDKKRHDKSSHKRNIQTTEK